MYRYPKLLPIEKHQYVVDHLLDGLRVKSEHAELPDDVILKQNAEIIPKQMWHDFIQSIFQHRMMITMAQSDEVIKWCYTNCKGHWDHKRVQGFHITGCKDLSAMRFRFENDDDAAFFKLAWL